MSLLQKLNTLFRAGAREAAEGLLDANALRVYEQEIIDAESVLARRRDAMAELIVNRREMEAEIDRLQKWVRRREQQVRSLPEEARSDSILELAAREIAAEEQREELLKREHEDLCARIAREEAHLRQMMGEIREHRRDLKLLSSKLRVHGASEGCQATLSGRLQSLRQSRTAIGERLTRVDWGEQSVQEVGERLDESPLQRALDRAGQGEAAERTALVLARLSAETSAA